MCIRDRAKNVTLQNACYVDFWPSTLSNGGVPGYQGGSDAAASTDGTDGTSDASADSSDGSTDSSDGSGDYSDGSSDDGSYDDGSSDDGSYDDGSSDDSEDYLSLIHISEPTRRTPISYAVFCLKKKSLKKKKKKSEAYSSYSARSNPASHWRVEQTKLAGRCRT